MLISNAPRSDPYGGNPLWSIQLKEQEQPPGRVEYIVLSPPMGSLRSVLTTERSKKNTENRKRLCEAEVPIYRAQAGFIRRNPNILVEESIVSLLLSY